MLLAVVDPLGDARAQVNDDGAIPGFDSLDMFWDSGLEADIAVIATPNFLHAQQSIAALQHGLHVICEKPMALHAADAKRMFDLAFETGKQLFIVKQNRFNPPVVWLKQILEQGALGQITNVQMNCFWQRPAAYYEGTWRGKKALDGGTLYTQFSHFVDLLVWLFGPLELADAYLANLQHQGVIETEDTGIIRWHSLLDGMPLSMHYSVNAFARNVEGSLTVMGSKGTVKIGGAYLNQLEYAAVDGVEIPTLEAGQAPNSYGLYQGSMSNHNRVYDQVVQVLAGKGSYGVVAEEAIETIHTIEAVYAYASGFTTKVGIRDVEHGQDFQVVQPVNLYGCSFGDACFVGPFVEVQRGVEIGNRVRIQSHSFICEGVSIGDDCFIGHGVMFINDVFEEGKPAGGNKDLWRTTEIGHHVSIGSNATILPVRITNHVVIGAGAVVTNDIFEPGTYVGNPARKLPGKAVE